MGVARYTSVGLRAMVCISVISLIHGFFFFFSFPYDAS